MIFKMNIYTLKTEIENIVTLKDMSAYSREHIGPSWEKLLQKDILWWSFINLGLFYFFSKIFLFSLSYSPCFFSRMQALNCEMHQNVP